MGSIDNRIVKMDFQNAQFQKGVSESLSSLKNLSQSIKDTSGTKLDGISASIESVGSKFTWLNVVGVTALQSLTNTAISFGSQIASSLIDPLVEGGKRRALNIEQAKFQFEGLGMDVDATMNSALAAVKGTAYGLDEAAKVAGIFGTSGMQAGEDMTKALRAIAGTAAMSGASFMEIGDIFTDVAGKGKAQAEDFNRLAARGVGATAMLAKSMGVTEQEVRDMAAKGKIDFQTFSTAMYDAFGEHATKANETYTGSLSNMKAALSRIGASFATAKFERQRQIFNALTPAIDATATALAPVIALYEKWQAAIAATAVDKITNTLVPFIEGLAPVLENVSNGIQNLATGLKTFTDPIAEAFSSVFGDIPFLQNFLDFLTNISEGFETLTSKMRLTEDAQGTLQSKFETFFTFIRNLKDALKGVGDSLMSAWDAAKNFVNGFLDSVDLSFDFAGKASEIGEKLVSIFQNLPKFAEDAGTALGEKLGTGLTNILDFIKQVGQWIQDNVSLKDIIKSIFGAGAIVFLKQVYDSIQSITDLIDKVKGLFDRGGDEAAESKGIMGNIQELFGTLGDTLNQFTQSIKIGSLVLIAGALLMLSVSIKTLADIDPGRLTSATIAMGAMFTMLSISMSSFTKSLKGFGGADMLGTGAGLLLVAFAIRNMASAVETLGEMDTTNLISGLGALAAVLAGLVVFTKKGKFSAIDERTGLSLLLLAAGLKVIASAMEDIGSLPAETIAKGLVGMAGALAIMSGTLWALRKKGNVNQILAASGLVLASLSLLIIGKALAQIGELDWETISRGLTGMTGALAALTGALTIIGRFSGGKSILAAAALLIAVQSLEPIAEALNDIGKLPWSNIANGVGGLAGVIGTLGIVLTVMGKVAPLGSVVSSAAILIAVQSLEPIADALEKVGRLSWDAIGKGLVGMGVAVGGLAAVIGILGSIAPVASLIGAGSILIASKALEEIADSLVVLGGMSWGEIARGLSAMLGALSVLALGSFANTLSAIGGLSLNAVVGPLDDLAGIMERYGSMEWSTIGKGLSAMGGALATVGFGTLLNTLSIIGSISVGNVAEPLGVLADSVQKWADIRVPQNLAGDLGQVAAGVTSFTFAFVGAKSIQAAAEPLGLLADSVQKWATVTVPSGMNDSLSSLAEGVQSWTFAFAGAWAMGIAPSAIGYLADAVRKWEGVNVPKGIEDSLRSLGNGVQAWSFAFVGTWAAGNGIGPIGDLADAVRKWEGVIVPKGIEDSLRSLANGVQAWSFAFVGTWSMGNGVAPISDLADSVRKWEGVNVPKGIEDSLRSLSEGVQSWTWAFAGTWSMGNAIEPLTNMADAISKWKYVSVPEDIQDGLERLSSGVQSFGWFGKGTDSLGLVAGPMGTLADSVAKWQNVQVPKDIGTSIQTLADGVKRLDGIDAGHLSEISSPLSILALSVGNWGTVSVPVSITTSMSSLVTGLTTLSNAPSLSSLPGTLDSVHGSLSGFAIGLAVAVGGLSAVNDTLGAFAAGISIMAGIITGSTTGISASMSSMTDSVRGSMTGLVNTAQTTVLMFVAHMTLLGPLTAAAMVGVAAAIRLSSGTINSSASGVIGSMYDTMRLALSVVAWSVVGPASSVGAAISQGIARGISSNSGAIAHAADIAANRALASAKAALSIRSPSRKMADEVGRFIPEGIALGIMQNMDSLDSSSSAMAKSTVAAMKNAVESAASYLDADADLSPVLTPVLDMSKLQEQSGQIGDIFTPYNASLSTSLDKANSVEQKRKDALATSIANAETSKTVMLNYQQYNNSPKSLSSAEIYRQTRNQLSTMKEGLKINA